MTKKISIIGCASVGSSTIESLKEKGFEVVVIYNETSFLLNGIRYEAIKTENRKDKISGFLAVTQIMSMNYGFIESRYQRKLPDKTDIILEYGLIQQKKSKLSQWERKTVVWIFEKTYRRIE